MWKTREALEFGFQGATVIATMDGPRSPRGEMLDAALAEVEAWEADRERAHEALTKARRLINYPADYCNEDGTDCPFSCFQCDCRAWMREYGKWAAALGEGQDSAA